MCVHKHECVHMCVCVCTSMNVCMHVCVWRGIGLYSQHEVKAFKVEGEGTSGNDQINLVQLL